ncbi:MAG: DEAD/DEAH box helicase family protein [Helicobacter sp.]|nr:DEAD/DEAH box helicase family protein [Helicobacter sp.]
MPKNQAIDKKQKLILNQIIKEEYKHYLESFKNEDFISFTQKITLQDYQQEALRYAFIALDLFFKQKEQPYPQSLSFKYHKLSQEQNSKFEKQDSNRASFWMATGSGKTIVMIKLMSLLFEWISQGKIPKKPIMLLAPNDKILSQFKERIIEYNNFQNNALKVCELKNFENAMSLFDENIVYITRSDLLDTDENVGKDSKAKRLNYKNYHNKEGWYILLDEAHKGDSKASVRKKYINDLARGLKDLQNDEDFKEGGFIFNFSATFDDELDLQTCAFNYNLEKFNTNGYGKNIAVLDSTLKAFKDKENESEKLERIIESFILFWAIKKSKQNLFEEFKDYEQKESLLYHNPLIIAVSDKVNTQNAGIKLYFEAIVKVLQNDIANFKDIATHLCEKLKDIKLYFGNSHLSEEFLNLIKEASLEELRQDVFYSKTHSHCEACKIKGNAKELVFKAKNSPKPFLLLNIGNTKEWEKEYIQALGIDIGEDLTQGYFDSINEADSPINIMMGSKVFSEGWDSNRVNLVCFINIGSREAKKYVLQTIGRGVRIEPFKHIRKRLGHCNLAFPYSIKDRFKAQSEGLETLFVMASDKEAIKSILEQIESFSMKSTLRGFKVTKHFMPLLVPRYKDAPLKERSYEISRRDYRNLTDYIDSYDKDVLLLSLGLKSTDFGYSTLCKIKSQKEQDKPNEQYIHIIESENEKLKAYEALQTIDEFFHSSHKELDKFTELNDEIRHFNYFSSTLDARIIDEINEKIKKLVASEAKSEEELKKELQQGKIDIDTYTESIKQSVKEHKISCYKYEIDAEFEQHYYTPLIFDRQNDQQITYALINDENKNAREIQFLDELKKYLQNSNNILKDYEWCFSKLVENVDSIFIPYFDKEKQNLRKFYPDFIFWLQHKKDKTYKILFIDPKGLEHESNSRDKAQSFEEIFKNCTKTLEYNRCEIKVDLFYYSDKKNYGIELKPYVKASIEEIFKEIEN